MTRLLRSNDGMRGHTMMVYTIRRVWKHLHRRGRAGGRSSDGPQDAGAYHEKCLRYRWSRRAPTHGSRRLKMYFMSSISCTYGEPWI